jgi:hypothetical protein
MCDLFDGVEGSNYCWSLWTRVLRESFKLLGHVSVCVHSVSAFLHTSGFTAAHTSSSSAFGWGYCLMAPSSTLLHRRPHPWHSSVDASRALLLSVDAAYIHCVSKPLILLSNPCRPCRATKNKRGSMSSHETDSDHHPGRRGG